MRLFGARAILVAVALLAALTAANAALGPRYGGELTIAVAPFGSTEPRAGHTAGERLAVGLVHETLLTLAPDGGVRPSLAGAWTSSAAGREWSFTLDPHARFIATDGTDSGSPAASHAQRPIGPDCSPTWLTQPVSTSSTSAGSMPVRSMRCRKV